MVAADRGAMRLRIEDIDRDRARPEWEAAILSDLDWLGLDWIRPVMRQSDRMAAHGDALDRLWADGLLYRCDCSRRDVAAAASAPQEGAPLHGPDGIVYPGTCRGNHRSGPRPRDGALRLDAGRAVRSTLRWADEALGAGTMEPDGFAATIGDVVLSRRGWGTSYHLAVVVDDAAQDIDLVTRGADLAEATPDPRRPAAPARRAPTGLAAPRPRPGPRRTTAGEARRRPKPIFLSRRGLDRRRPHVPPPAQPDRALTAQRSKGSDASARRASRFAPIGAMASLKSYRGWCSDAPGPAPTSRYAPGRASSM